MARLTQTACAASLAYRWRGISPETTWNPVVPNLEYSAQPCNCPRIQSFAGGIIAKLDKFFYLSKDRPVSIARQRYSLVYPDVRYPLDSGSAEDE